MNRLETKVPPVIVFIISAIFIWLLAGKPSGLDLGFNFYHLTAFFLVISGLAIALSAVFTFRKNKTTVDPINPEKAEEIVTEGIFQYSRNPMYLGLAIILAALSVTFQSLISIAGVLFFITYITRFQIMAEERAMIEIFDHAYQEYMKKVRRWI